MKLNVLLITYNQEKYIRQTVESILMQKTDFVFNIVVADDCSPDSTLSIIDEYAANSEVEFVFLPKTANLGFVKNYQRAFEACKAQYIAIMEGDDYWTSPQHLQHHVDFLDQHPECAMSFNRHIRLFEDQHKDEIPAWENEKQYETFTTEQQIQTNKIGNLSCCVFRTEVIKKIKPETFDNEFADWLLGMIMGQYGLLAYQKEVTSAYRIHDNGQWSRMTEREQYERLLSLLDTYNKLLDYKHTKIIKRRKRAISRLLNDDEQFLTGRIKEAILDIISVIFRNF